MRHLFKERKKIAKDAQDAYLYLFLDLDGTLAPIRKDPKKVKLSEGTKSALKDMSGARRVKVAVISGRELSEAKRIVGVGKIIFVGNHGFEAEGPGIKFIHPAARKARPTMKVLNGALKRRLKPFKGVIVEDKKLTLSVHYRMADKAKVKDISRIFSEITAPYAKKGKIRITRGKKVWEVRPPAAWNKGSMVAKLLAGKKRGIKRKVVPFYLGDDTTDEDAFRRLGKSGYAVRITCSPGQKSAAGYFLRSIQEVRTLLKYLYTLRKETL